MNRDRIKLPFLVSLQYLDLLAVLESGTQQTLKLSARLQNIEPSKSGQNLLTNLPVLPDAVSDLKIAILLGGLNSEKHS